MIFYITNQSQFISSDRYSMGTIQQCIEYLESLSEIYLDSETTGLDPHINKMFMLQVGDKTHQFVIDVTTVDTYPLKKVLEEKTVIGQNLKFDLKFLYRLKIYPLKVKDTLIAERVINPNPAVRAGLKDLCERYVGVYLDKTVRNTIDRGILDTSTIVYGAKDIEYLQEIMDAQNKILLKLALVKTAAFEYKFIPVIAYMEYCGFKLDTEKWKEKMERDGKNVKKATELLNEWVIDNNLPEFIESQLSLFESRNCSINWSAPKQVLKLFLKLGIPCKVIKHGKEKHSVEEGVIKKYAKKFEIVDLYLDYKKKEKVATTYGQSFLDSVSAVTKRLHTKFTQIKNTGRMSSGGDKGSGSKSVNFQNIPRDKETRSCFVAEKGNTLVIADYSGQEQVILANKSLDPSLLHFYDNGGGDMHSFIASKIYKELEGLSAQEIKANHSDKRQNSKSAGLSINYGGVGLTIANDLDIPVEEGEFIYNAYFEAFPGLKSYFDSEKKKSLNTGYILISEVTRRKYYIEQFEEFKAMEAKFDRRYWETYRSEKEHKTETYEIMKEEVSKYFKLKGSIERNSLNYPIQGVASEITKLALIYFFYNYIIKEGLMFVVLLANTIHDEVVAECPAEFAEKTKEALQVSMENAGKPYCKRIPLKADPVISPYWTK